VWGGTLNKKGFANMGWLVVGGIFLRVTLDREGGWFMERKDNSGMKTHLKYAVLWGDTVQRDEVEKATRKLEGHFLEGEGEPPLLDLQLGQPRGVK